MSNTASISGLASGIQWRDMIDQIMKLESARKIDPITQQISQQGARSKAWTSYQGLVTKLKEASATLRAGTAYGSFKVNVPVSATSGRTLFSATASTSAVPGTYQVEVAALAKSEKLSGS